jgi:uncharacterized protein YdaU (DUF1376 family)
VAALPYMRMYWADYGADTPHLTTMQHGIYLLLIKNYWQRGGPLPNDDAKLAKIAGVSLRDWKHNRDVILEFFTKQESLLVHQRLALELSRVEAKSLNNKRPGNANAKRTRSDRDANETRSPIYTEADTDTEGSEANASAEIQMIDPEAVMWRHGRLYLQSQGVGQSQIGSLLGKWKKEYGSEAVIVALGKAQREGAIDPVSFITRCLSSRKGDSYDRDRITV